MDNNRNLKPKKNILGSEPGSIFLGGFSAIIVLGTILLMLPISSSSGTFTNLTTALFTATSAVCVTGLVVVDTLKHWSFFGKVVILILIQVGGIGFMSLVTVFSLIIGKKITLKERLVIQQSFNQNGLEGLVVLVKNVLKVTLLFEGIAALILTGRFLFSNELDVSFFEALWLGVFHSISAFCNAGFGILPGDSLSLFKNDFIVNMVIMILIITGGLGASVWQDVIKSYKKKNKSTNFKKQFSLLSLHSKIALSTSALLILAGFLLFLLLEFNNPGTIGEESFYGKSIEALFYSVTLRTAGFNTFSLGELTPATKFLSVLFMLIGGSPGGTAGGIKTVTTFAVIVIAINSIKGNEQSIVFRRKIPQALFSKALTILILYMCAYLVATMLLLISMPQLDALNLMYEVASALGTVGVTSNTTMQLNTFGRIVIMICMFMGRLGPITIAVALLARQIKKENVLDYPEESIMLG